MIRSKTCFKCRAEKPLSEFYRHAAMRDGLLGKCKPCTKKDATENRNKKIDYYRQYDRERAKLPERIALAVSVTKAWRAQDASRSAAHSAVARAIRQGVLHKENCARCGAENSMAHHEDYSKKLEVVWLCAACHKQRHKEIALEAKP